MGALMTHRTVETFPRVLHVMNPSVRFRVGFRCVLLLDHLMNHLIELIPMSSEMNSSLERKRTTCDESETVRDKRPQTSQTTPAFISCFFPETFWLEKRGVSAWPVRPRSTSSSSDSFSTHPLPKVKLSPKLS